MTSSPPPPFDDGGDLPVTRLDDDEALASAPREPNYLLRRAIAIGAVIAALAGGSILAGRIIGGDDGGGERTPSTSEWDTVVVIADDEVRLLDPASGEVTGAYPGEEPLLDAESLVAGTTLVLMNDFGRITELDLTDGTIRRSSATEGSILVQSRQNGSIVLAGPPGGGDVAVVDTHAGTSFDIGRVADLDDPLMFVTDVLANRAGSHVATADARSFQSVLVEIATGTPVLLAGQVVALDDNSVVTAQRAGERAELEFYDLAGERRGSVEAPSPKVTMLTGEASALIVADDGTIATVTAAGQVDEVGTVTPLAAGGTSVEVVGGDPAFESERLVVQTDDGVVVLDTEGAELARVPGEVLSPVSRVTRCVLAGDSRPNGTAIHLDLDTGEQLGEVAGGLVASASADGCTLALIGDAPRIVANGVDLDLGTTSGSVTLVPDGTAYVVTSLRGEQLVSIPNGDDEPADPVELADEPVLIRFANL